MQVDELIVAKLLFCTAGQRGVVELDRTSGRCRSFYLEKEKRAADGDLVTRRQDALFDGNAIYERPG